MHYTAGHAGSAAYTYLNYWLVEQLPKVGLQVLVGGAVVLVVLAQLTQQLQVDLDQPHAQHRDLRLVLGS